MTTRSDAWAEARRLVVHEAATYPDAATATGIPVSTIQKRAAAEGWQADRDTQGSYSAQIRSLKAKLLERALAAASDPSLGDPSQLVFAWKQAEAAFPEHRYRPQQDDPKARLTVMLDVVDELVAYLTDVDRNALTALAPHIVKFGEQFKAKHAG